MMQRRTRVLVVSPVASHPATQGNSARIQIFARKLQQRGVAAELLYYGMEGLTERQRAEMTAFWDVFHFLQSQPLPEPRYARYWGIDDWCPETLSAMVAKLHAERHYDAVLVNYVWMSGVLEGLTDTFRIIDTHDLFGNRHLAAVREGLDPRWYFTSIAEENRGFARADLLIGIQEVETRSIRERVSIPAMTIGHLMDPVFLTTFAPGDPLVMFGYLGSGNPWNVRSVLALDAAIGADGGIDWMLAGSLLQQSMKFRSRPFLLGTVERLDDFYRLTDCVVNPMQGGTGLKIKTVEALSFGKPVIGTADAFQGLPARHPAQDLADAAACAEMMRAYAADPALRAEIRIASRICYLEYMIDVEQQFDRLHQTIGTLR